MATIVSRRLTTKLMKPSRFSPMSISISFYNLISHRPQNLNSTPNSYITSLENPQKSPSMPRNNEFGNKLLTISQNPINLNLDFTRRYSNFTSKFPNPNPRNFSTSSEPELKHQEIEGPTVERDLSPLANETREAMENLMKTIYGLSKAVAFFGLVQLGLGAWISYLTRSTPMSEVSVLSAVAFAFPFSVAFVLRQSLKPIYFFKKMEDIGRLQILTLALQFTKNLNVLFVRVRGVTYLCVVGVSAGFIFTLLSR